MYTCGAQKRGVWLLGGSADGRVNSTQVTYYCKGVTYVIGLWITLKILEQLNCMAAKMLPNEFASSKGNSCWAFTRKSSDLMRPELWRVINCRDPPVPAILYAFRFHPKVVFSSEKSRFEKDSTSSSVIFILEHKTWRFAVIIISSHSVLLESLDSWVNIEQCCINQLWKIWW